MKIRCKCGTSIMKSQGDVVKLRSRIIIVEKGQTIAKCMNCGSEVAVPLIISEEDKATPATLIPHYVTK